MNHLTDNTYEETFYIIPRYIRKLRGLTLSYLDVYETIFQFWNKNKNCFLSEDALCKRTGHKRTQIYEALRFFELHGELKRIKKNNKRYLVRPEKFLETDISEQSPITEENNSYPQASEEANTNVRNSGHATSGGADYNIKKLNKENNKTNNKTKETVSVSVFSCNETVKNHIETVVSNRDCQGILDDDIIAQGVFYAFETNPDHSYSAVNKRINIFLKKLREGNWLVPQGWNGITSQSIREEDEMEQRAKRQQYEQDGQAFRDIARVVLSPVGEKSLANILKKLRS